MKHQFCILFAFLSFCFFNVKAQNTPTKTWSKKAAHQWFKHGDWRDGLQIKPSKSVNEKVFATQYHQHQERWDKAFAFLNRKDLASLDTGTYPIIGKEVFASISKFVEKDFDKSQWEAHRKYADIQCMMVGKEKIGMTSVSNLTVTVPYDDSKDIAHYKGPGKYYVAEPGIFFIFFPGEAHRPNIKVPPTDTSVVKKIVIKVQVPD